MWNDVVYILIYTTSFCWLLSSSRTVSFLTVEWSSLSERIIYSIPLFPNQFICPIWVLINFNFKIFYLFWTSLTPNFNQILISFLFFFTNSFFEFLVIYFFLIFDNLLFMHCFVLCTTTLVDHSKTGQTGQFVILSIEPVISD